MNKVYGTIHFDMMNDILNCISKGNGTTDGFENKALNLLWVYRIYILLHKPHYIKHMAEFD